MSRNYSRHLRRMSASGRFPPIGGWSLSGPFKPVAIDAEEFVANGLPGMDEDGALVGLNWNAAKRLGDRADREPNY